jgi:hypothetical protein
MSALLQRARESGKCPPSLLTEDRVVNADGFEASVTRVLDAGGKYDRMSPFAPRDLYRLIFVSYASFI